MARYVMPFERPVTELEEKLAALRRLDRGDDAGLTAQIEELAAEIAEIHESLYTDLTPWMRVQIARHPERPKTQDYVARLFEDVIELHGDRQYGDDEAMFAGLGTIEGRRCVVLGHRKGKDTKENLRRNFGSSHPEGFRKATRVMRLADRFGLPIVSFLDTSGAYPGMEAEERGQGWAIAEALETLAGVTVPVVVVGIGEGGSGGALAIGFGDRMYMLENSYYSVISPEGCASILYKDAGKAEEASVCLKMTAEDLLGLGIVDEIVPEPVGGAHRDPDAVFAAVGATVVRALDELCGMDRAAIGTGRYERLRAIGVFEEVQG
jgi:acetyl-CoA carboxylase carboxyl transferase subunit alpha